MVVYCVMTPAKFREMKAADEFPNLIDRIQKVYPWDVGIQRLDIYTNAMTPPDAVYFFEDMASPTILESTYVETVQKGEATPPTESED